MQCTFLFHTRAKLKAKKEHGVNKNTEKYMLDILENVSTASASTNITSYLLLVIKY